MKKEIETRSTKELLQVILDNFYLFGKEKNCCGLCELRLNIYYKNIINNDENVLIKKYMSINKPKKTYNNIFWFEPYESEPRKQWLIEEIKKH